MRAQFHHTAKREQNYDLSDRAQITMLCHQFFTAPTIVSGISSCIDNLIPRNMLYSIESVHITWVVCIISCKCAFKSSNGVKLQLKRGAATWCDIF